MEGRRLTGRADGDQPCGRHNESAHRYRSGAEKGFWWRRFPVAVVPRVLLLASVASISPATNGTHEHLDAASEIVDLEESYAAFKFF